MEKEGQGGGEKRQFVGLLAVELNIYKRVEKVVVCLCQMQHHLDIIYKS